MKRDINYGTKQHHGLYWGINEFVQPGWRIANLDHGGSCQRLHEQDLTQCQNPVVVMGNVWAHKDFRQARLFRHPDLYELHHVRWFFWDNPQLPHLLYRGPHNPHGYKNWMRICEANTVTTTRTPLRQNQSGNTRINEQLRQITQGEISDWRDIVGHRRHQIEPRGRTVLICPSGTGIFPNYYGINKSNWIQERTEALEKLGYRVVLRDKPTRSQREINDNRLHQVLAREDIAFTVSIHSVVAMETLIAGVPAVVEGRHPGGELATPWEEFLNTNAVRQPEREQVDQWVDRLLCDTFHKSEAYSGTWY